MGPKVSPVLKRSDDNEPSDELRPLGWGARGSAAAAIAARLTCENVGRRYGTAIALEDASLDVAPGEIIAMLGASGSGKSTLLRLAAGVERPTSGRILINGQEVAGPNRFVPPEKRNVGLMFQDFALFPHLTILQNVAFGLQKLSRSEAHTAASAALERVGLSHYADAYPHILSGGEQQRVALARAISPRPSVILMDEPFSGLDSRLRETMREETLSLLHEMRATCIVVTHSPEEAMRMGNRIALMRKGRLVQVGTAQELYRLPRDIEAARMFSDLNEIAGRVVGGTVETPLGRYPANGFNEGEPVVVCVRQSTIRIVEAGEGPSARTLRSRFLGDSALLDVGVDGLEEPLVVRLRQAESLPPGQDVGVSIDPDSVLLFSGDAAD